MQKKSIIALSLAVVFSGALSLNADESIVLDQIEVTSNSAGAAVDDIKISTRNAGIVKDVVRDIPGVYVGGTNGMNQKIYMRGVSDRGLNITIDGAKQNGNTFHHNADLLIDPDLIKAIDIEVGAKSVVNANGALGGSVAFKTVDAKDLLEGGEIIGAKIKAGYSSNDEGFSQGLMVFAAPVEGLDFLAALNHKGYDYGKAGNGKVIGGNGNDLSYLFKIGYNFLDFHRISISHEHTQFKGDYPLKAEFGYNATGNAYTDTKYERDTTTIKYTYNPSDLLEFDVSAYNTEHKRVTKNKWGVETKGINAKATTKLETGILAHTLRYGIEYYNTENFVKPNNNRPEEVDNYSLYLEDAIRYGDLIVTPGVRYTRHELKTYNGTANNISKYKYKFDEVTPALGLDYNIGYGFGVFASYARVFRGPDVMESMLAAGTSRGNALGWNGNDDLKATTGNAYEIGGRYKNEFGENKSVSLTAKYYKTEYKNLIVDNNAQNGTINNVLYRINAGGADIDGVELWSRLNLDNLSLAASYTHQKVKYTGNRVTQTSRGTRSYAVSNVLGYRDQGDKYTFNTEYFIPRADILLGYNLIFFKSRNVHSASSITGDNVRLPSYAVNDFYIAYIPSSGKFKGLEINAGLYNAFDKAYASHSQRTAEYTGDTTSIDWEPGRNFKVNVSYKF
ncbi:TonB-dependent receptor [Campylobacter sp. faydin G-140]|uniref:TonB-dependent receptor domain-containing protein n=1 Tax=Campylobacter anatolicus TaxID=2829105 RepID=UPI001B9E6B2B|nr:TonB-dependent receptor [Campylobacter anatolicus]MBR8466126.1 TonB-dependent receptor [Campylobacter anatolicus]